MITNISLTRFKDGQVRDNRIIVSSGLENSFFHAHFEKMDRIVYMYLDGVTLDIALPISEDERDKYISEINQHIQNSLKSTNFSYYHIKTSWGEAEEGSGENNYLARVPQNMDHKKAIFHKISNAHKLHGEPKTNKDFSFLDFTDKTDLLIDIVEINEISMSKLNILKDYFDVL